MLPHGLPHGLPAGVPVSRPVLDAYGVGVMRLGLSINQEGMALSGADGAEKVVSVEYDEGRGQSTDE